jgi:hypothetical protein
MSDTNKEDVLVVLRNFENYIKEMSHEDFKIFLQGRPVFAAMLPPRFNLMDAKPEDMLRAIPRLEFRIL